MENIKNSEFETWGYSKRCKMILQAFMILNFNPFVSSISNSQASKKFPSKFKLLKLASKLSPMLGGFDWIPLSTWLGTNTDS